MDQGKDRVGRGSGSTAVLSDRGAAFAPSREDKVVGPEHSGAHPDGQTLSTRELLSRIFPDGLAPLVTQGIELARAEVKADLEAELGMVKMLAASRGRRAARGEPPCSWRPCSRSPPLDAGLARRARPGRRSSSSSSAIVGYVGWQRRVRTPLAVTRKTVDGGHAMGEGTTRIASVERLERARSRAGQRDRGGAAAARRSGHGARPAPAPRVRLAAAAPAPRARDQRSSPASASTTVIAGRRQRVGRAAPAAAHAGRTALRARGSRRASPASARDRVIENPDRLAPKEKPRRRVDIPTVASVALGAARVLLPHIGASMGRRGWLQRQ